MKLNMGGVKGEKEGFKIVSLIDDADYKHDLNDYPLPFDDDSIDEIRASHILEHMKEPLDFLQECNRIMKPGAIITIIVPHKDSTCSNGTMEHRWHFNEHAIKDVIGFRPNGIYPKEYCFDEVKTKVDTGRILFWRKYQITWILRKRKKEQIEEINVVAGESSFPGKIIYDDNDIKFMDIRKESLNMEKELNDFAGYNGDE